MHANIPLVFTLQSRKQDILVGSSLDLPFSDEALWDMLILVSF